MNLIYIEECRKINRPGNVQNAVTLEVFEVNLGSNVS